MDDNIREIVDKLKRKTVNWGNAAGDAFKGAREWAGDAVEIAKLNMKIFDLNSEINTEMRNLGEIIYNVHNGLDSREEDIERILLGIDGRKEEIEHIREHISALKNSVGCPVCGYTCAKDDRFCKRCGAELER